MPRSQGLNLLEIFVLITLLGTLSAVAAPQVGHLVKAGNTETHDVELGRIQTAVVLMLKDSHTGKLVTTGPTDDMSKVKTTDTPPLLLSDYLKGLDGTMLKSGRTYGFTTNGTVIRVSP